MWLFLAEILLSQGPSFPQQGLLSCPREILFFSLPKCPSEVPLTSIMSF